LGIKKRKTWLQPPHKNWERNDRDLNDNVTFNFLTMKEIEINTDLQNLYSGIAELIKQAKTKVAVTVNAELALLNWRIGIYINQFILQGNRLLTASKFLAIYRVSLPVILDRVGPKNNWYIVSAVRRVFQKSKLSPQCGNN
jgi:hypothetical protein